MTIPLPPYSSIKPRKKKRAQVRVGRVSGCIRLSGKALEDLHTECWCRYWGYCQECGRATWAEPRFDGDPDAYDMAHIVSRGAGGSDTIENVRCLCHRCHQKEHTEGREKEGAA